MAKTLPPIKANRKVPQRINLVGEVQLAAKQGDDESPKFVLMANTGIPMRLPGFFDPVIVDLTGAQFDQDMTPVIVDHDPSQRIGHTVEAAIIPNGETKMVNGKPVAGPMIAAVGVKSSKMEVANQFIEDAQEGFPFQVSIGASIVPGKVFHVDEKQSVEVNGRTWKGPLIVAKRTVIRELSVTVLGADGNTSATLAATSFSSAKGKKKMTFEEFVASLHLDITAMSEEQTTALKAQWELTKKPNPTEPNDTEPNNNPGNQPQNVQATQTLDLTNHRATMADETARIDGINACMSNFTGLTEVKIDDKKMPILEAKQHAIREGMSVNDFELICRRSEYPQSSGPAIHIQNTEIDQKPLVASLLRQTGCVQSGYNKTRDLKYGLEAMFDANTLEKSHERIYNGAASLRTLMAMQVNAVGKHIGAHASMEEIHAAAVAAHNEVMASGFSTLSITNILEDAMHKTALASFNAVESVWPYICGRRPVNDFKAHNLYRLDFNGDYVKVAADGELKHISMTDTKYTIQADTYGAMVTIDRKTIKNDDLSMVIAKARALGSLGAARIEESVLVLLLSNPSSFFSAGNGNLLTGASSALSIPGLTNAKQKFRDLVINNKPIGVSPTILLCGTPLEETANRLWAEDRFDPTRGDNAFTNNPHKGMYRPYVSPYLSNTAVLDQDQNAISGQSDTKWFLFADPNSPQGSAITIAFMDGRETPHFAEAETQFNVPDGMQFRSYLDWGVAMHVTQMGLQSNGT